MPAARAKGLAPPPGEAMVYIGPRPTMSYVFEVVAQLHSGAAGVVVKARGLAIAKAVDVVEVVRHKLLVDAVEVGTIRIETERLVNRAGRETRVSAIAIPLRRPPGAAPPPADPTAAAPAASG